MASDAQRYLDRLAKPGDDDIDLDVDGVTITAVVRDGFEFVVRGTGGYGWWIATDGTRAVFAPGDPDSTVDELNFVAAFPDGSPDMLDHFTERLERWRDAAVPVHVVGAPGRMTTLIVDRDDWLPLPRAPFPSQG